MSKQFDSKDFVMGKGGNVLYFYKIDHVNKKFYKARLRNKGVQDFLSKFIDGINRKSGVLYPWAVMLGSGEIQGKFYAVPDSSGTLGTRVGVPLTKKLSFLNSKRTSDGVMYRYVFYPNPFLKNEKIIVTSEPIESYSIVEKDTEFEQHFITLKDGTVYIISDTGKLRKFTTGIREDYFIFTTHFPSLTSPRISRKSGKSSKRKSN
jgi:hypothetical protein